MSRGKQVLLTLAVALAVAVPAKAVTRSGSVAATDDRAPEPVSSLSAFNGPAGVELSWDLSSSDFVRQSPAGLDFTSGGTFVNVNDVARYNVWRSENSGAFELAGWVEAGETDFVDEAVVSGSIFVYEVRAADAAGNESADNEQSAPVSLGPPPIAVITPDVASVDFGDLGSDESTGEGFAIANEATDPLAILSATITVTGEGFSQLTEGLTVEPGNSATFSVSFSAADVGNINGSYTGTLMIRTNDPNNREIVIALAAQITGGISGPDIDVTPTFLTFSRSRVVNTTGTKTVELSNTGGQQLTGTITLTGSSVFSTEASLTIDEAPEASRTITVTFTPTSVGDFEGELVFASNDPDEPAITVSLTGGGVTEVSGPGTVTTTVTKATITFDVPLDVTDLVAVEDFKEDFIDALASALGISRDRILVTSVLSGSIVVEFTIAKTGGEEGEPTAEEALADLQATLADTTASNPLTESIGPVTAFVDNTESVTLQPMDTDGEPILGWFSRGGTQVGFDDFFLFADNFGLTDATESFDPVYDIAPEGLPNGKIDFDDFFRFADDFGKIVANAAEIQDALE